MGMGMVEGLFTCSKQNNTVENQFSNKWTENWMRWKIIIHFYVKLCKKMKSNKNIICSFVLEKNISEERPNEQIWKWLNVLI